MDKQFLIKLNKFLIKYNIRDIYIRNFIKAYRNNNYACTYFNTRKNEIFKQHSIFFFIHNTFLWDKTPEGWDFWSKIADKACKEDE